MNLLFTNDPQTPGANRHRHALFAQDGEPVYSKVSMSPDFPPCRGVA